jgi:hypothetical protein
MFGISWSGFNALQMAMKNVPELKTIIAVDATEDLNQDDVHFMDGIMHVDSWEMSQDLDNSRPGAPDYVIDEAYFHDRFDTPPWMMATKAQQRDGPYWDRASLKRKYDRVKIPVFLIGGWYDGYRNSILRLFQTSMHQSRPSLAPGHTAGPMTHFQNLAWSGAMRRYAGSITGLKAKIPASWMSHVWRCLCVNGIRRGRRRSR